MNNEQMLQQSKNWDNYINGVLKLNECEFNNEGFPRFVYNGDSLLLFKLIMDNGDIIEKAYVDLSEQYMADGKQWINVKNRDTIYSYRVIAWKEVE